MRRLCNNRGQGLIEYMVIVALMAVATMGIMRVLSQTTRVNLAKITQSLQGGKGRIEVEFEDIDKSDIQKKDMGDFIRGSRSRRDR